MEDIKKIYKSLVILVNENRKRKGIPELINENYTELYAMLDENPFQIKYSDLISITDNEKFIEILYLKIFNRKIGNTEKEYFLKKLDKKELTKNDIIKIMIGTEEYSMGKIKIIGLPLMKNIRYNYLKPVLVRLVLIHKSK